MPTNRCRHNGVPFHNKEKAVCAMVIQYQYSIQCFDTVGRATGGHPASKKRCSFVGVDDVTGAVLVL